MHLRTLLAGAALLSVGLAAHATSVTVNVNPNSSTPPTSGMMSPYSGVTTINFNGSTTVPTSFSGGIVTNQSVSGAYAAPAGDTTNYFAVGSTAPSYTGSATFTPGGSYNYFGLYWGSIDTYNTISFYKGDPSVASNLIQSFTGSQVPPATGNQTAPNTNEYVNFLFTGGTYDHVVLSTSSANFELDNVAYGNVTPEPSSLALLGTGLLGVAGVVRKRLTA